MFLGGGLVTGALDGADLALEFQGALDVTQDDGAGAGARDLNGAVVEDAAPEVLLDKDALHLADDNLMGVAVYPAVAVEKTFVTDEDGCCQVADQATQVQVGPSCETGLVYDGLARGDNLADFHNLS